MVAAVAVFGTSFGVLAGSVRTPAWLTVLMSATVFAGSSQFAALAVVASGGGVVAAVVAGLLLNLRYFAIGTHAGPSLPRGRWRRLALSHFLVDEGYALGLRFGRDSAPHGRTLVLAGVMVWTAWVGGTAVGALLGPVLGDPRRLGLDAAFPAAFLALLWPLLTTAQARLAALAGGVAGLALATFVGTGPALAVAAAAGLLVNPGRGAPDPGR